MSSSLDPLLFAYRPALGWMMSSSKVKVKVLVIVKSWRMQNLFPHFGHHVLRESGRQQTSRARVSLCDLIPQFQPWILSGKQGGNGYHYLMSLVWPSCCMGSCLTWNHLWALWGSCCFLFLQCCRERWRRPVWTSTWLFGQSKSITSLWHEDEVTCKCSLTTKPLFGVSIL